MEDPADAIDLWFGDDSERELGQEEMYLAVYAAGGGKRNMVCVVVSSFFCKKGGKRYDLHQQIAVCCSASSNALIRALPTRISLWHNGSQQGGLHCAL
jgi:hypothetical protein